MVVWLLIYLPGIVGAVLWLVVSLGARRHLSSGLVAWGGAGLAMWLGCLMLEGTAKTVFIPREMFRVEVMIKETFETVAALVWGWALWRYRKDLQRWLTAPPAITPHLTIPWHAAIASTLAALLVPAAVIGGGIALNPQAREKARGDQYFHAGRYDEAARAYQTTVALAPNWARVWDRLGVVEFRRGDLEAAARAFAEAERLSASDPTPTSHRAAVRFRQGRYTEAAQAFALATKIDPADAAAQRNLGVTLQRLGRDEEAEAAFHLAEQLGLSRDSATVVRFSVTPDLHLAYLAHPALTAGLVSSRAGRFDLAISQYQQVVDAMPALAAAHLALANELLSAQVARRVVRSLTPAQALEEDMDPALPFVAFAHSVRQLDGRWEPLEPTVQSAALAAPLGRDELRDARDHYQDAIKLGAAAPAHLGLGLLAREAGDLAEAQLHLEAARALDPGMPPLAELVSGGPDLATALH
jgi:tetratricopeptide (TPR) repeat protein